MTGLQVLEDTVDHAAHHASSRAMAKVLYQRVQELLAEAQPPRAVYDALEKLYDRYRAQGHTVERDAVAEILDWFDDEGLLPD